MTNKALFIQAFTEADNTELEKYLNKEAFSFDFSEKFENKMQRLIAKDKRISLYTRKKISKALIAAIIALIIMFMGLMSVSAYRQNFVEFIEKIFSNGTEITVSQESNGYPETIETEYTLDSVPEGFLKTEYSFDELGGYTIWENNSGQRIQFFQYTLDMDYSMDNENEFEKIELNGYPAYLFGEEQQYCISWSDGEYWFNIKVPVEYKESLIQMAKAIKKVN